MDRPRALASLVVLLLGCVAPTSSGPPSGAGGAGGAVGAGGAGAGSGGGAGAGGAPSGSGGAGAGGAMPDAGAGGGGGGSNADGGGTDAGGRDAGGDRGQTAGVPLDPALLARCTGTSPIRCALNVPANGNYDVTVQLGDSAAAGVSRVQAELLRVVVPQLSTAAGSPTQQTFTVSVRAEQHDGYTAPGQVLDLLIDGPSPRLGGLGLAAAPAAVTVFLAGDSTVCDWDPAAPNILAPDQRGWGQELSQYLARGVAVANYADSGETAGSFYGKFFTAARNAMKAGDYLLIQFGHNDQKAAADIAAYQANLMRYVADARARNVTPVLLTPVARRGATAAAPGFEGLDQQVRDLAAAQGIAVIDLTTLAINHYRTVANLPSLFAGGTDSTHFSESGATQVAGLVAQAIKAGNLPLRDLVK